MKLTVARIAKGLAKTCCVPHFPQEKCAEAIRAALHLMEKNGLRKEMRKFIPAFTKEWKKENSIIEAKLITAKKTETHMVNEIKKTLETHLAKKIKLEVINDPSLIAGYILQVEDKKIDASLKTRLRDLETTLKKG